MDWKGRRVVIVGAGRQGTATAAYLARYGARVTLTDLRRAEQLQAAQAQLAGLDVDWQLGAHPVDMLNGADALFVSGGVPADLPLVRDAQLRGIPVTNDSQLFLEMAQCPVIGITGSAGKTTTTILVGRMLKATEGHGIRKAWIGGNIGNPLLADVDEMQKGDAAVMELSSFQLEWMTKAPHIAAILNLAPNHLDRHGSMTAYAAAKARIIEFQTASDIAVLNRDDVATWVLADRVRGRLWSFGRSALSDSQYGSFVRDGHLWLRDNRGERAVMPLDEIELIGEHNAMNVFAAAALAAAAGVSDEAIRSGVRGFRGAPHRLELVRTVNGVDWYNDSIATAPQRTEADLRTFDRPVVLLLGGRDKGLPWEEVAKLATLRARYVVFFGEAAPMLGEVFSVYAPQLPSTSASDLATAVKATHHVALPGDIVLLAPGGTSFDEFVDFEERGERFRALVNAL